MVQGRGGGKADEQYGLLVRLLREQRVVNPQDDGVQASSKPSAEISFDTLRGASDQDATYRGPSGKGYMAQIVESFDPARPAGATVPYLITHAEAEPPHMSEVHAVHPAIEAVQQWNLVRSGREAHGYWHGL